MPSKAKKVDRDVAKLPSIPRELVSLFLTGPMTGETINAAGIAFKKALIEASLNAELSHHLGYAPGSDKPEPLTNHRNGSTAKTVLTGDGKMLIETPRDREGSFEPLLLPKHARRFTAFDDSIVALYARGLTVREIQGYLVEIYGTEVSPQLISTVTDGVLAEVTTWQSRPLEAVYAVVFFDALRVKIREDNVVRNKAVYLALGVRRDGTREILGLWIETTEGAKFWMKVFNDLRSRGVLDILIAVTDGLTGMPTGSGLSADDAADLHRAPDPQQPRLCQLEGPQAIGGGAAPDLCRSQCGGRRGGAGCVRGWRMGTEVPHRGVGLAPRLGAGDPVLHLSARDQAGDLHHQCD
jgi:putative transposase